jgi:hypothetical protein
MNGHSTRAPSGRAVCLSMIVSMYACRESPDSARDPTHDAAVVLDARVTSGPMSPDATHAAAQPCAALEDFCEADAGAESSTPSFGPRCVLSRDTARLCATNPYRTVTSQSCGLSNVVWVAYVDTGFIYYYDAHTDQLTGIEASFANASPSLPRRCVAGRLPPPPSPGGCSTPVNEKGDAGK